MKVYNANKEFLLNANSKNDILAFYPDLIEHKIIREKASNIDDIGNIANEEYLPLVVIGGKIDGCINLSDLDELTDKMKNNQLKNIVNDLLQKLCNKKQKELLTYFDNKNYSYFQQKRYKEKYEMAIAYQNNGDYSNLLEIEANIRGITINELATTIIEKHNISKQQSKTFTIKIEAFRAKVQKMVNNLNIIEAMNIIQEAEAIDINEFEGYLDEMLQ